MRIALFHNLPSGGAKRSVYEWTRRLSDSHALDAYTFGDAEHAFGDIRPFVRKHYIFDFVPNSLFGNPFGRLNQYQRWRDLGELKRIGRKIGHQIDTAGYDVVFAHPCRYTLIPAFLSFLETPSVYYLHEPFGPTFKRQFKRPYYRRSKWREITDRLDPLIALYRRRLEKMRISSIKRSSRMLANSRFTQQHMKLAYNIDARVSYLGANAKDFYPIAGVHKENCVISVGELTPRKGFDFLVECLAHIPSGKRPALKLVCNWIDPAEKSYLEDLATLHNIEMHVLTRLSAEELTLEFNKAQLCVYAPVLEPFGLVPLESMACGTPVVGVSEGGVRETVVDHVTGRLVDRDPTQFAEAVLSLLDGPELRKQYGQQAREHILEEWTWDRSVAQLEQHLQDAASQA